MSKFAVIEVAGKQEKVSVGDTFETVSPNNLTSFKPILLSLRKGSLISDTKKLNEYDIKVKFLEKKDSKKHNIFQYKAKTGNRRRMGYKHPIYIYEVSSIDAPKKESKGG